MSAGYCVQAYKAKGSRLVGQATEGYAYPDAALSAARRLASWRAGIVVFRQEVDDRGVGRGRPETGSSGAAASRNRGIFKAPMWGVFNAR